MTDVAVAVVGGGLAGLFTATLLAAGGSDDLVVLDQGTLPGGAARTIVRDGYAVEPAVGSMALPHPHLSPLLDAIGAEVTATPPTARGRMVATGDRLVRLAPSPRTLLARLLPPAALLRALGEPLVPRGSDATDEALEDFLARRFGAGAGTMLAWLAAAGVHAGDPSRLSAQASFPALTALEQAHGSLLRGLLVRRRAKPAGAAPRPTPHTPVGGMAGLVDAAAARLGDRYRPNAVVESIRRDGDRWRVEGAVPVRARHVVLACRPQAAADLVGGALGHTLRDAVSAPVAVVALGARHTGLALPEAFGALAAPRAGTVSLGFLFESSYAPHRTPAGSSLVKVIAGGATRPDVVEWDDEKLVETVGGELARVLGVDVAASFVEVIRHVPGIPQYVVGHRRWLEELDSHLEDLPGLHLTGWGYRGVGITHLATDASRVAGRVGGSPRW